MGSSSTGQHVAGYSSAPWCPPAKVFLHASLTLPSRPSCSRTRFTATLASSRRPSFWKVSSKINPPRSAVSRRISYPKTVRLIPARTQRQRTWSTCLCLLDIWFPCSSSGLDDRTCFPAVKDTCVSFLNYCLLLWGKGNLLCEKDGQSSTFRVINQSSWAYLWPRPTPTAARPSVTPLISLLHQTFVPYPPASTNP